MCIRDRIVGPYSIGYGIWELQILGEWPLGETVWPFLDSLNTGVSNLQTNATNWFSAEVSFFGRTADRTQLLAVPFVALNAIIVIGAFVARRRTSSVESDSLTVPETSPAT